MKIGRKNVQNAKFNPAKVLDIEIDIDEYRSNCSSSMFGGLNNKEFQKVRAIYREYEKSIEDIIASKVADMVPIEMSEYIKDLRILEYEIIAAKDLLNKKQEQKYHEADKQKKRILDIEIIAIKDKFETKKIELSRFISENKDVKLSYELVMLNHELRNNIDDMVNEIDDMIIALSTQIKTLKALRILVNNSSSIVREQLSKRLGCNIDSSFTQSINEEKPLLIMVNNKRILG